MHCRAREFLEELTRRIAPAFRGRLGIAPYQVNINGKNITTYGIAEFRVTRYLQRHPQGINDRPIAVALVSDEGEILLQLSAAVQGELERYQERQKLPSSPRYNTH